MFLLGGVAMKRVSLDDSVGDGLRQRVQGEERGSVCKWRGAGDPATAITEVAAFGEKWSKTLNRELERKAEEKVGEDNAPTLFL